MQDLSICIYTYIHTTIIIPTYPCSCICIYIYIFLCKGMDKKGHKKDAFMDMPYSNPYNVLLKRMNKNNPSITIHLGNQSVLTRTFPPVSEALLRYSDRLEIPLCDASAMGAWYFRQLEECIKDTFRAIFMISYIRDIFASSANLAIFHSDYLFPYIAETVSITDPDIHTTGDISDKEMSKENEKINEKIKRKNLIIQVIRKIFDSAVKTYICPLYNFDAVDKSNHTVIWRNGGVLVLMMDIVSDRRKLKKKKSPQDMDNPQPVNPNIDPGIELDTDLAQLPSQVTVGEDNLKNKKKGFIFSPAFIDKFQWEILKNCIKDSTVTSIVICTQSPILPLSTSPLPTEYTPPQKYYTPEGVPVLGGPIPKGEIIEFLPTANDLTIFFEFFFKWLLVESENLYCSGIYICIFICIYTCIYIYIYMYIYVNIYIYMYVYIYIYICICAYMYIHVLIYIYMYIYIYTYIYKHMLTYLYTHVYIGRSVSLVSSGNIAYTTIIQDISSGVKVNQFCIAGNYDKSNEVNDNHMNNQYNDANNNDNNNNNNNCNNNNNNNNSNNNDNDNDNKNNGGNNNNHNDNNDSNDGSDTQTNKALPPPLPSKDFILIGRIGRSEIQYKHSKNVDVLTTDSSWFGSDDSSPGGVRKV
jgi:hypothetical protein